MRFSAIFLFKMHQILPILYIMIKNNYIYYLMVVKMPKENSLALKWAQLGPKRGQNEVSGHFFDLSAFDFADFAYHG